MHGSGSNGYEYCAICFQPLRKTKINKKLLQYISFIVFYLLFFSAGIQAGEFKWARAKFRIAEENLLINKVDSGMWDIGIINGVSEAEKFLIQYITDNTNIKISKKLYFVDFTNLDELCKYPFVFMHASGTPVISENETNNIREYLKRGGFIFAEDCVFHRWEPSAEIVEEPDNYSKYRLKGSAFFRSFKKYVEKKLFPGKKMKLLSAEHPIYHSLYNFKNGLPFMQGEPVGGYGFSNEKGRLKIFLSNHDIHCGWGEPKFSREKDTQAIQMGINIVTYVLTH